MSTPQTPPKIGLWRRITDSEAFIFVAETWPRLFLFLAVGALGVWAFTDDERWITVGMAFAGMVILSALVAWWRERLKPLPKPKPPKPGT